MVKNDSCDVMQPAKEREATMEVREQEERSGARIEGNQFWEVSIESQARKGRVGVTIRVKLGTMKNTFHFTLSELTDIKG